MSRRWTTRNWLHLGAGWLIRLYRRPWRSARDSVTVATLFDVCASVAMWAVPHPYAPNATASALGVSHMKPGLRDLLPGPTSSKLLRNNRGTFVPIRRMASVRGSRPRHPPNPSLNTSDPPCAGREPWEDQSRRVAAPSRPLGTPLESQRLDDLSGDMMLRVRSGEVVQGWCGEVFLRSDA